MSVRKAYLIGTGTGSIGMLTVAAQEAISACGLIIGAARLLEPFADAPCEKMALTRTSEIVRALQDAQADEACVLFSGDVGFYSGTSLLLKALAALDDSIEVDVIPGISSVQYLCAKAGQRWDNVKLASAHGRDCDTVREVRQHGRVLMLTGGAIKAHDVCAQLEEAGLADARVWAGERLSYPDERIVAGTAAELARLEFSDLAVLLIDATREPRSLDGMPPRILVCAPRSGSGKTSFTCGLLRALQRRGMAPLACKCGPDYIDPMFHRAVIGVPSRNVDLFFMTEEMACDLLKRTSQKCDIAVIEGAMGYYDGIASSEEASAWHVSRATATPAVLVVDAHGAARSLAAEVLGFVRMRIDSGIAGVVLNRVSASYYPQIKSAIEEETGIPVLGFVPKLPEAMFESRHLGLVTAEELPDLQAKVDALADAVEEHVDIDALLKLAGCGTEDDRREHARLVIDQHDQMDVSPPIIAVARDEAFCFYYEETFDLLERMGATIAEFSPLHDGALPEGACGLFLGGGYPELHAQALSENVAMRTAVAQAIRAGMPTIAECGGFLYLHETLSDADGDSWSMAGVISGEAHNSGKLGQFGYVALEAHGEGLLVEPGDTLRAHEFHYWASSNAGEAFTARKPQSNRSWECCHELSSLHAGFPHLYLPASPKAAQRFVDACMAYASEDKGRPA